jgi:ATP-dependent helicase/DNAse subunit B
LFDSSYYEEILSIVEQKIEEAINNIINAKFDINPKVVKGENISCKFCKYKDICYKKYKDSVVISQAGDEDE